MNFFVRVALLASVVVGATDAAWARAPQEKRAYQALGVSSNATQAELDAAIQRVMALPDSESPRKNVAIAAYDLLSSPSHRAQYDRGEKIEMHMIAGPERRYYEELLRPVNPGAADRLRRVGRVGVEQLSSAATFYLAVGITTAWKCVQDHDPVYCREYLNSLQDPIGHVGFGLFIGTSHLTTRGLNRVFGPSGIHGMAGLAGGSFVSGLFTQIASMPETKELLKLNDIRDPQEREKKKRELLKSIWTQTFGSRTWWRDQVPGLISLLGAATASHATQRALIGALRSRLPKMPVDGAPGDRCSRLVENTLVALMGQNPRTGATLSGGRAFLQRRGAELANLLVFMGYEALLHPVVAGAWNSALVEAPLRKKWGKGTDLRDASRPFTASEEAEARKLIDERMSLWDRHRRHLLEHPQMIMYAHTNDLIRFDEELERIRLFYQFFARGFKVDTEYWKAIQDRYFGPNTVPDEVQKELLPYMRAFFAGVSPQAALKDALSWKGLPVPGRVNATVQPYRAVEPAEPRAATLGYQALRARFVGGDYWNQEVDAYSNLQAEAAKSRRARIAAYEKAIDHELLRALRGKESKRKATLAVPDGILPVLQKQREEIELFKIRARSEEFKKFLDERANAIAEQEVAAQELVEYFGRAPSERAVWLEKKREAALKKPSGTAPAEQGTDSDSELLDFVDALLEDEPGTVENDGAGSASPPSGTSAEYLRAFLLK